MPSRRVARLAEAIRETVSSAVLFNLRDPRIRNVTVVRAEVTPDLRSAKVFVSVRGSERDKALSLQGLDSSRGFLQSKIADRIQTRYTPILRFVLDENATDRVSEASRILAELAAERAAGESGDDPEGDSAGGDASAGELPAPPSAAAHEEPVETEPDPLDEESNG